MDYGVPDQNVAGYGEEEEPQYEGHYEAEEGNYDFVDNVDDSAGVKHDSSSSAGKLFVGGIAWETSEESFGRYFQKFGEITDSVIMMDRVTGRPRGFGFVTFADVEVAEKVLQQDHVIDGRSVEIKRTVPRGDSQVRGVSKTKKIFVGGLPLSLVEEDLREYFSPYGTVVEQQIMLDHTTGRSRGFGFVTFDTEEAVEKIFSDGQMHELGGKQVEIKRAEPKRSFNDKSTDSRFRRGGSSSKSSGNYASNSEGFGGGYGGKMGRSYGGYDSYGGGYGGYGNFSGNYAGGAAGFYGGYGGYGGYGYGFGGPMYGGAAYGSGSGYGASAGYGGGAGYGVGKGAGYGGGAGGYDGGKGFGGGGSGGGYGPGKGYGNGGAGGYGGGGAGGYGGGGAGGYGGKGYGNNGTPNGRFHPYRK